MMRRCRPAAVSLFVLSCFIPGTANAITCPTPSPGGSGWVNAIVGMTVSTCLIAATGELVGATKVAANAAVKEPGEFAANRQRQRQRLDFIAANYAALRADTAIGNGEYLSAYATLLGCSPEARPRFAAVMRLGYQQLFDNDEDEEATLDATIALLARDEELAPACAAASAATLPERAARRQRTTTGPHEPLRMLVLDLQPRGSVRRAVADALTPLLLASLADIDGLELITVDDINALFEIERMRDVADCDTVTCATEIGGALGARLVLHGTLGRIGPDFVLTLTIVDTHTAGAIARVIQLAAGRLALTAAIAAAAVELARQIDGS